MYLKHVNDFGRTSSNLPAQMPVVQALSRQTTRQLGNAQNLFREGDDAVWIYEVVTGVLRLSKVLENGRRQVIAFGYPGDIIGFPKDGLHHTECDAVIATEVITYSVKYLEGPDTNPDLHLRLVKAALHEIWATQDHLMMLGSKSASEKLASFLNVMMDRLGKPLGAFTQFEFSMCRSDIADFLGLTVETVSRTFSQFRSAKVIALESAKSVIVLKPETLRAMAETE